MARPVNEKARAAARALAEAGMDTAGIVEQLAADGVTVSRRQVQRWCGGLLGGGGARPLDVDTDAVAAARGDGASWREVERRTGVSRDTARRRMASGDAPPG
jgi:DNA invertase Pin-like site-specific DNA recombinase